jgi:hypothetical protein
LVFIVFEHNVGTKKDGVKIVQKLKKGKNLVLFDSVIASGHQNWDKN